VNEVDRKIGKVGQLANDGVEAAAPAGGSRIKQEAADVAL
jgi:hypothetical protein